MRRGAPVRRWRWVVGVYVVGFVEGTCVHAYDVVAGGLQAYASWPLASQVLFHALLGLDLWAAVLVLRRRPTGPVLAAAIMAADLTANWWGNWGRLVRHPLDYLQPVGLLPMTLFGLFVFATAAPLRREFRSRDGEGARAASGRPCPP